MPGCASRAAATTTAGLLAGSIALVGSGLDGAIEGLAIVIVIWRFSGSRTLSVSSERRAQQLVAVSFFLLAPYVAFEATRALLTEHHAETTLLGIGLSIGTLCVCPWLGRAKLRLGQQLGSPATAGEGRQNLLCAYLALAVLAGLLANTLHGRLVAGSRGCARDRDSGDRRRAPCLARRIVRLRELLGG